MLTSERLLKIISVLTVLVTVVFSTVVVISELMKPEKMLDRIVEDECGGVYTTDNKSTSESDLKAAKNRCILISKTDNPFQKRAVSLGRLEDHHYLYKGPEGVLLKKESTDFSSLADHIQKCIRTSDCTPGELEDSKVSVTGLMYDRSGEMVCSTTFYKTSLFQVDKGFRRLFTEMCAFKKQDLSKLALKLLFHHSYTFVEQKEPEHINGLLNNETDGLYISSRGAKIRVLPFEYSKNAMKVLDRKGRQYGLKKDEYKNELAKIYLFRTSQYFENGQKMVPWAGSSALLKKDYSDNIVMMFLRKHLENVLNEKKRFPLERNISDGKRGEKDASFFTQLSLAEVMIDSPKAVNILGRLLQKDLSDLTSSYLFNIINLSGKADMAEDRLSSIAERFSDFEKVKTLTQKDPVYTGFFLESHLLSSNDPVSTEKLFDAAEKEFGRLNRKDKIRLIIYLGKLIPPKNSPLSEKIHRFINDQAGLFKEVLVDSRGFYGTSGSISTKRSDMPDTALSLAVASGLAELKKQGLLERELLEIESGLGSFIRFITVTGDDFPRWKDPQTKVKVQGGVRSFNGSDTVKLSNTIRAYNYFRNRLKP